MCLLTTTWLTLQLRLYSSWLNNYPFLLTLPCHILRSSGTLPSREQTTPSEISPCSQRMTRGAVLYPYLPRYHPWVTSSVDLGQLQFLVFSPFVWLVKRPINLQMFRLHLTVSTADQVHLRVGNWFPGCRWNSRYQSLIRSWHLAPLNQSSGSQVDFNVP
jgi:hypothetical protein